MKRVRTLPLLIALAAPLAVAQFTIPAPKEDPQHPEVKATVTPENFDSREKITDQGRIQLMRSINAELAFARKPFPRGEKGFEISDRGELSPEGSDLATLLANEGPAARVGDRVRVTDVAIKGNKLVVEINGGPKKKAKWYERIQVGGAGGMTNVAQQGPEAKGSVVTIAFAKHVPQINADEVKQLLVPVLDFNAKTRQQVYIESLPPKVQEAIKNKQVLVGMDREMVTASLGRPQQKFREKDGETEYEEWMYGQSPQDVQFVRFVGDDVTQVKIMKVDGEKIVRTEKEVDLGGYKQAKAEIAQERKEEQEKATRPAPTLRRPGDDPATVAPPSNPNDRPTNNPGRVPDPNGGRDPSRPKP